MQHPPNNATITRPSYVQVPHTSDTSHAARGVFDFGELPTPPLPPPLPAPKQSHMRPPSVQVPDADEDVGSCWDAVLVKLVLLKSPTAAAAAAASAAASAAAAAVGAAAAAVGAMATAAMRRWQGGINKPMQLLQDPSGKGGFLPCTLGS